MFIEEVRLRSAERIKQSSGKQETKSKAEAKVVN